MNTELSVVNVNEISIPAPKQKKVVKRKVDAVIVEEEKVSEIILVAEPVSSSNAIEAMSAVIIEDDASVLREMMREKDELEFRIKMFEEQKKIKRNIGEYRETLVVKKEELKNAKLMEMERLREELMTIDMDIDTIKTLSEDELVSFISTNSKLMEDCGLIQDKVTEVKKSVERKPAAKPAGEIKAKVVTKTMKPADRWAILHNGAMFRAKHKEVIRYYMKIGGGRVAECDREGNLNLEIDSYAGNQEAANAFKKVAGMDYAISGWEFLQLYNKETDKAKSLKKWDGEPEYLLW